jgi:FkbM family methyltransferase
LALMQRFADVLPTDLIRKVSRLQWKSDALRKALDTASLPLRKRDMMIVQGVGRGLRFNAGGANLGYVLGTSEPDLQDAFRRTIQPGMTVYDLGASVGFHSVLAARLVGESGFVYSFEPMSENVAQIEHNMRLNGTRHFAVQPVALWDSEGTAEFNVSKARTHGTLASIGTPSNHSGVRTVKLARLDGLVEREQLRPPDVMKIDIEGAETAALRGAQATIDRHQPLLYIDIHGTNADVADFLDARGYRTWVLSTEERSKTLREAQWWVTVVAAPSARAEAICRTLDLPA